MRKRGEQKLRLKSGNMLYLKEKDTALGRVGFLINKKRTMNIYAIRSISPRVLLLISNINKRYNMVIQTYAPTANSSEK